MQAFALALLAMPSLQQDTIFLADGRLLDGLQIRQVEGGVVIHYEHGDVFVPSSRYVAVVIASGEYEPQTEEERQKLAQGLVRFEGRWVSLEARQKLVQKRLDERRAALEELRQHQEWRNRYKVKTKHFDFEHTLPPQVFERYRDLMEAYFESFAREWKVKAPAEEGRLLVCFYHDEETFHQVGGVGYGVLGYFRFVKPWELNVFYEPSAPWFTEEVMFHESNHYLQKLIDEGFAYPHFPGESLAEYYGASRYDAETRKVETGLVLDGRLVEVKEDIAAGEVMPLRKLVETEGMYEHYTWGWSLVHFLMHDKRYTRKFQDFYVALAKGKDVRRVDHMAPGLKTVEGGEVLRAFMKYLGLKDDDDMKRLEAEWHAYVKDTLQVSGVHGLEEAGLAAISRDPPRPLRAKRLFQEAVDKGSTNAFMHHRYAELLSDDDKHAEAIAMWRRATALDPLNPRYYVALAVQLMEHGGSAEERQEGARLAQLAGDIDPENPWLTKSVKKMIPKAEAGEPAGGGGEKKPPQQRPPAEEPG